MFKSLISIIVMFTPSLALAHSGHGHIESASIWHLLLEIDHIGWVIPAVVVLLTVTGIRILSRNR